MVVLVTISAEGRLRDIFDFYRDRAGRNTAAKIVTKIREHANALGAMPFMAPVEQSLNGEQTEFRSLVVAKRYKIVYHVAKDVETVYIVDIWDCRQSPESLKERVFGMFKNLTTGKE
ncbi:MAG: type II toxin-antitoxin system RelE/ParE family toxin [Alistipes sp.]|jgi:plasmid stabilization system protein ParE|nr:type II toxin-antitoxin system RelE/ParE family toxin [Alistipes sp.]